MFGKGDELNQVARSLARGRREPRLTSLLCQVIELVPPALPDFTLLAHGGTG